ncbi:MAG: fatty acid desaturase [Deltaproteobacteria bacterium]|nr:fatty acid desaturase [Deltaproteobacteria bacterium]
MTRVAADRRVLAAAALHGALVLALVSAQASGPLVALLLALLMAWGANTVAHIHLHTPLFASPRPNRALSLYLTALLGFPQSVWRHRHLRHHAGGRADRVPAPPARTLAVELGVIALVVVTLTALAPAFALGAWLPAIGMGLLLCSLQGRMEHARGEALGISCYGRLHNGLWFNDGFHVEHHRWPGLHWSELPRRRLASAPTSRLPPWLRPFAELGPRALDALERLALRSSWLQRALVARHLDASRALLARAPGLGSVLIVGGGLFPRSVHVMRALAPGAHLEVVDRSAAHLEVARAQLAGADTITWRVGTWEPHDDRGDVDLVVLPLAYRPTRAGDRRATLTPGPSPRLVHTWLWTRTPHPSAVVAWWLLKKVVLVPRA